MNYYIADNIQHNGSMKLSSRSEDAVLKFLRLAKRLIID